MTCFSYLHYYREFKRYGLKYARKYFVAEKTFARIGVLFYYIL